MKLAGATLTESILLLDLGEPEAALLANFSPELETLGVFVFERPRLLALVQVAVDDREADGSSKGQSHEEGREGEPALATLHGHEVRELVHHLDEHDECPHPDGQKPDGNAVVQTKGQPPEISDRANHRDAETHSDGSHPDVIRDVFDRHLPLDTGPIARDQVVQGDDKEPTAPHHHEGDVELRQISHGHRVRLHENLVDLHDAPEETSEDTSCRQAGVAQREPRGTDHETGEYHGEPGGRVLVGEVPESGEKEDAEEEAANCSDSHPPPSDSDQEEHEQDEADHPAPNVRERRPIDLLVARLLVTQVVSRGLEPVLETNRNPARVQQLVQPIFEEGRNCSGMPHLVTEQESAQERLDLLDELVLRLVVLVSGERRIWHRHALHRVVEQAPDYLGLAHDGLGDGVVETAGPPLEAVTRVPSHLGFGQVEDIQEELLRFCVTHLGEVGERLRNLGTSPHHLHLVPQTELRDAGAVDLDVSLGQCLLMILEKKREGLRVQMLWHLHVTVLPRPMNQTGIGIEPASLSAGLVFATEGILETRHLFVQVLVLQMLLDARLVESAALLEDTQELRRGPQKGWHRDTHEDRNAGPLRDFRERIDTDRQQRLGHLAKQDSERRDHRAAIEKLRIEAPEDTLVEVLQGFTRHRTRYSESGIGLPQIFERRVLELGSHFCLLYIGFLEPSNLLHANY